MTLYGLHWGLKQTETCGCEEPHIPITWQKSVALWKLGCSVLHGSSYTALHPWNRAILEDNTDRTDGDKKHLIISLIDKPANHSYWEDVS